MMPKLLLLIALFFCLSVSSIAQVDKNYNDTLKSLFEVSGTESTYQVAIQQMFGMYKEMYTEVDASTWDELELEFSKTSLNELTKMLAPVYKKYLSIDDLNEIIRFYNSPVGKKFAENTPLIMQESMQIGQEWGKKIGEEFLKKMEERGY